ncbi:unnamed protein product [Fraxinus pennsylvanica]|uniref:Serine-threonine kinase receptor-associated protein n=1 Tax=Fraxinus pennsylvanica TaxID=56036 RepID=A0AAD1ZAJ7_9LAMI|nr:unnamed protein product [Fraxinus pennsylvanica]
MDKKKVVTPLVCHGHSRPVVDLFYSPITPDGFFLVSASKGEFILSAEMKLWDALTGDELHSFEHKHIVRTCAFSEDSHRLLTGGVEKLLRIFDLNRPDVPPTEVEKSPVSVRTVAWLHSDQTILSSCIDMGGARLWDVRTATIVRTLETVSSVTCVEVSQEGRYITSTDGSTVKFWDANQ